VYKLQFFTFILLSVSCYNYAIAMGQIIRLELESESKSSCQYGKFADGTIFAIDIIRCF